MISPQKIVKNARTGRTRGPTMATLDFTTKPFLRIVDFECPVLSDCVARVNIISF